MPALTSVTIASDSAPDAAAASVQTGAVVDVKLTTSPEETVALTVTGPVPSAWLESAPKVMVWIADVTVKCWLTGGAAA